MHEHEPGFSVLMERIHEQNEQRALWQEHDSPEILGSMIVEEAQELQEAIENVGEVFEVVSEIGDVLYLVLKLCYDLGIRPEDAVQMKILRNDLKYPADLNSHGDYPTARQQSKDVWEALGGDVAFSHAYLELFAGIGEEARPSSVKRKHPVATYPTFGYAGQVGD